MKTIVALGEILVEIPATRKGQNFLMSGGLRSFVPIFPPRVHAIANRGPHQRSDWHEGL